MGQRWQQAAAAGRWQQAAAGRLQQQAAAAVAAGWLRWCLGCRVGPWFWGLRGRGHQQLRVNDSSRSSASLGLTASRPHAVQQLQRQRALGRERQVVWQVSVVSVRVALCHRLLAWRRRIRTAGLLAGLQEQLLLLVVVLQLLVLLLLLLLGLGLLLALGLGLWLGVVAPGVQGAQQYKVAPALRVRSSPPLKRCVPQTPSGGLHCSGPQRPQQQKRQQRRRMCGGAWWELEQTRRRVVVVVAVVTRPGRIRKRRMNRIGCGGITWCC